MILPVVACLMLAPVLVWETSESTVTVGQIEQSDQRIALARSIETLVVDEETGLRGYQVTSDPRFLQPYHDAEPRMAQAIAQLQSVAGPEETRSLNQFVQEHQTWHQGFAEPVIAIIAAGGRANDDDLNLTGRARMDTVRALLEQIVQSSEQPRVGSAYKWHSQTGNTLAGLFVLTVAVGLMIAIFTRNRLEAVSDVFNGALNLQRRRAEELFHSEQNLRTTLASIGDGVITCDVNGRVQMMNPVAQELTGWIESHAQNRPLEEVFHIVNESTRQPVENPVAKVQRLTRVVGIANHTVLIRRDGSELAIDDSGAPIRNEGG